jgi:hypothetical protein
MGSTRCQHGVKLHCPTSTAAAAAARAAADSLRAAAIQGLTLVHFSAQLKRWLWDRGCMQGMFRGCSGGIRGCYGVCRVYFVSETAQVELRSGRV